MKQISLTLLVVVFLTTTTSLCFAENINGMVRAVYDGDTISVISRKKGATTVRLFGIDAPETGKPDRKGQPHSEASRRALMFQVLGKAVNIEVKDVDQYGRIVGIVRRGGSDINAKMVAEGMAWAYRQYLDGPYASEYINLEEQARRHRQGLWRQANPQPPWEFRKSSSGRKPRYH